MVSSQIVVLIAEDEPLIRMMAVDALSDAGFTVVEAEHADSALEILQAQADDVHVLFTDVHMPGTMDGLQLAHHAHGHWPWIAVLIASGQARPMAEELPVNSRFLPKPYDHRQMIQQVREMLVTD